MRANFKEFMTVLFLHISLFTWATPYVSVSLSLLTDGNKDIDKQEENKIDQLYIPMMYEHMNCLSPSSSKFFPLPFIFWRSGSLYVNKNFHATLWLKQTINFQLIMVSSYHVRSTLQCWEYIIPKTIFPHSFRKLLSMSS